MYTDDSLNVGGVTGSFLTFLAATGITQEVVQIIYYILGAVALLFSVSFTIWKWYRAAKKDGKITEDEIDDLFDQIKKDVDKEQK